MSGSGPRGLKEVRRGAFWEGRLRSFPVGRQRRRAGQGGGEELEGSWWCWWTPGRRHPSLPRSPALATRVLAFLEYHEVERARRVPSSWAGTAAGFSQRPGPHLLSFQRTPPPTGLLTSPPPPSPRDQLHRQPGACPLRSPLARGRGAGVPLGLGVPGHAVRACGWEPSPQRPPQPPTPAETSRPGSCRGAPRARLGSRPRRRRAGGRARALRAAAAGGAAGAAVKAGGAGARAQREPGRRRRRARPPARPRPAAAPAPRVGSPRPPRTPGPAADPGPAPGRGAGSAGGRAGGDMGKTQSRHGEARAGGRAGGRGRAPATHCPFPPRAPSGRAAAAAAFKRRESPEGERAGPRPGRGVRAAPRGLGRRQGPRRGAPGSARAPRPRPGPRCRPWA